MRKVLVTFGGAAYDPTIAMTVQNQAIAKVDEVRVYDDWWLQQTPFYQMNEWIFHLDRESKPTTDVGYHFGWCCWKPFIVMQEMKRLNAGDVVLYVDADTYPIDDLTPIFDIAAREKLVLFQATGVDNMRFTKAECFRTILDRDPFSSQHACGRFQAWTVGDWRSMQVLMEWQTYMLNPLCQFDAGSHTIADQPEFFRNSADQSSLSMLAIRYAIPLHREACQYGWPAQPGLGQPGDDYPQLFHQEYSVLPKTVGGGSKFRNV